VRRPAVLMLLLRHGQSYFNLLFGPTRIDPGIEDPELTPLGAEQAAAAARALRPRPLTRLIVSPFTRALQTAQPILATRDLTVEVMHEVRERAAFTCDIGTPPARLAARFPHHDFAHLPPMWWHDGIETAEQTVARADAFRTHIASRDDHATTLLVSHWAFIVALTGASLANGELMEYDPRHPAPRDIDWHVH
jgi:broad specificity phosphatase PhoE